MFPVQFYLTCGTCRFVIVYVLGNESEECHLDVETYDHSNCSGREKIPNMRNRDDHSRRKREYGATLRSYNRWPCVSQSSQLSKRVDQDHG